ncbi:MAG: endonuclease/exonuclease/phosphatase family protein [Niabella sp.]
MKRYFLICGLLGLLLLAEGAEAKEKPVIRILTYNVHHCNPPSKPGLIDINAVANVINRVKPDVVTLQEIDVHTGRSGKDVDEAQALAKKTGMYAFFLKNIDYDGGAYGIAILSKSKWIDTATLHLPMDAASGGEPRGLATVILKMKRGRRVVIACTHLDLKPQNRILQINAIEQFVKKSAYPVIIGGDFNALPGSDVINHLDGFMQRTCNQCPYTIPETHPNRTIDFIAFTPGKFKIQHHEVMSEPYASDHLPVFADLKIVY